MNHHDFIPRRLLLFVVSALRRSVVDIGGSPKAEALQASSGVGKEKVSPSLADYEV